MLHKTISTGMDERAIKTFTQGTESDEQRTVSSTVTTFRLFSFWCCRKTFFLPFYIVIKRKTENFPLYAWKGSFSWHFCFLSLSRLLPSGIPNDSRSKEWNKSFSTVIMKSAHTFAMLLCYFWLQILNPCLCADSNDFCFFLFHSNVHGLLNLTNNTQSNTKNASLVNILFWQAISDENRQFFKTQLEIFSLYRARECHQQHNTEKLPPWVNCRRTEKFSLLIRPKLFHTHFSFFCSLCCYCFWYTRGEKNQFFRLLCIKTRIKAMQKCSQVSKVTKFTVYCCRNGKFHSTFLPKWET